MAAGVRLAFTGSLDAVVTSIWPRSSRLTCVRRPSGFWPVWVESEWLSLTKTTSKTSDITMLALVEWHQVAVTAMRTSTNEFESSSAHQYLSRNELSSKS